MARPTKHRRICQMPQTLEFAPCTKRKLDEVLLAVDEYEAIRLIDHLGLTQEECAAQMNVARTTVQAIYDSARRKIADALVTGKRLLIGGGSYDICIHAAKCHGKDCSRQGCKEKCCTPEEVPCNNCKIHKQ